MKHFSGYGSYLLFLALRTHFNNAKYDFFQMHGKLRASKEAYAKRNDKFFFESLARDYDANELKHFYLANLLEGRHYITDMFDDSAHKAYQDYQLRQQSLTYRFNMEMETLLSNAEKPFRMSDMTYPYVIIAHIRNEISAESMVMLNDMTDFMSKFDKYYEDDIVWPKL